MNLKKFDSRHRKNLSSRAKRVKDIVDDARKRAVAIAYSAGYEGEGDFFFDDYPAAKAQMESLLQETAYLLKSNIINGNADGWGLSSSKVAVIVAYVKKHADLPQSKVEKWTDTLDDKLDEFNSRKVATVRLSDQRTVNMDLSSRVWNLSGQFKQEMELAVEAAMKKGMSADDLSREVRKYLNQPDKLFRRVRDKSGALRLSKAAQAYHPGVGVYRSSYMNAKRMTVTEINAAYRTADYLRWKSMPFIKGIEIDITSSRHVPDICDDLKGRYPKDFKFTGWHPFCKCHATPILPEPDEFAGWDGQGDMGGIEDVPENYRAWLSSNRERIKKAKHMPSFLKDNKKYSS